MDSRLALELVDRSIALRAGLIRVFDQLRTGGHGDVEGEGEEEGKGPLVPGGGLPVGPCDLVVPLPRPNRSGRPTTHDHLATALHLRGLCLKRLGRIPEALGAVDQAFLLSPLRFQVLAHSPFPLLALPPPRPHFSTP